MLIPVIIALVAFHPTASHTVSGKVTDGSGAAMAGVSIAEKGTKNATTSLADGSYSIQVNDEKGILLFSSVGFEQKKVAIKGRTRIDVVLKEAVNRLDEVVVVGDETQAKRESYFYNQAPVSGYNSFGNTSWYHDESRPKYNTEGYDHIGENPFLKVLDNPLSTFSIDVDAASYSNVRRFINEGQLPPSGAVRIEEMVNYFHYEYPQPLHDQPFSINTELSSAPWNKGHKLLLIGLQGKQIPVDNLPPSNLVFLIDVSGSMDEPNKLPLVQSSMKMLVQQLRDEDKVAIVVYAGAAGLVLPSTSGKEKIKIIKAIDGMSAGGSTAGGAGIRLAYKVARENFAKEGNNRVILCTDGDFNIGESSDDAMERLIEKERGSGVFLTVLGYGTGNYQDSKMQKLADKGNGNHAYIDGITEAKKVLVNEFGGTLFTIAKDVKLQVEFNPANVQGYRLIGYENRVLAKEDFNDDKKDAGELGSNHTVTALYEIIPAGVKDTFLRKVDNLKYQINKSGLSRQSGGEEMATVKFRYKAPDGNESKLIEHAIIDQQIPVTKTSDNFRFASSVAEFGMLLRNSAFKSNASFNHVISMAKKAKGQDEEGYRSEFIRLAESARLLANAVEENDSNDDRLGVQ